MPLDACLYHLLSWSIDQESKRFVPIGVTVNQLIRWGHACSHWFTMFTLKRAEDIHLACPWLCTLQLWHMHEVSCRPWTILLLMLTLTVACDISVYCPGELTVINCLSACQWWWASFDNIWHIFNTFQCYRAVLAVMIDKFVVRSRDLTANIARSSIP